MLLDRLVSHDAEEDEAAKCAVSKYRTEIARSQERLRFAAAREILELQAQLRVQAHTCLNYARLRRREFIPARGQFRIALQSGIERLGQRDGAAGLAGICRNGVGARERQPSRRLVWCCWAGSA